MGRKSGPNELKLKKIRNILKKNPQGLWVREIARKMDLDKSTVSIYLSKYMSNEIEVVFPVAGQLIKIVRLKK
jgi:DNA invertase Pin-like site-specific DNA recombinase